MILYPSGSSVGSNADQNIVKEARLATLLRSLCKPYSANEAGAVYSGLTLSRLSGTTVAVSAGEALVAGRLVRSTSVVTVTPSTAVAEYVMLYVYLDEDDLVTEAGVAVVATRVAPTPPSGTAAAVTLGKTVVSGGQIVGVVQLHPRFITMAG